MKKFPICKKETKNLITHNHQRQDDYFWLNERDSKDVLNYIEAENNYSKEYFEQTKELQEVLLDEFENRINPNDTSAPFYLNSKTYQYKNQEGKDYTLIDEIIDGQHQLFFDENERAKDKSYYSLADWAPSPDNKLLAISEDFVGRRNYTITIRNNENNTFLKDKITNTDGTIVWANDNKTLFYVKKDPQTLREYQVYSHILGSSSKEDKLIYEDKDERFTVYLSKSITNKYIEIHSASSLTSETSLVNADSPSENPVIFLKRKKGHIYEVFHHENGFYIKSNHESKNNKIVFSETLPSTIEELQVIFPNDKNCFIDNLLVLQNHLIIEERENGLQKVKIKDLKTSHEEYLTFNEETFFFAFGTNENYFADYFFYSYNSLTTPASIFQFELTKKKSELFFRKELLDKTFSPSNYESQRIWITANDGEKIAVSLVYKKGIKMEDSPLLLYGYGSYGITIPDVFKAYRLSLIDRGFIYAIAHIRGEKYLGEEWYENGKFLKKRNTFTDFINAAESLGMKGYCDKNRIYAQGGSAGGLLMGAVTNLAPYLWKGIIAQVPFVDVVTTMLDESIPLTVGEYEEWGNPNDEEYYWYMLSYSPYDNVKKMDYPAMFITTGYHDSQVQYWEPLKWVAKLREYKTNDLPLLLDCNMDAGHGGGSGRSNERIEIAKEYAFILNLEGIKN